MRIADLKIENFRGIKSAEIRFGSHTVLIGPNNSGKTTVIEALALLFGRDRQVRDLTEHDFFGSDPQPRDRIKIRATITDFPSNDPGQNLSWFRFGRAVDKWYSEETGQLFPERGPSRKLACQVAFCAYFDRSTLEVESRRFFYDHDGHDDPFVEGVEVVNFPSELIRELGFFLVPANRTWDRVISFGSELFKRVLSSVDGRPAESVLAERERLRKPQQPLDEDAHLNEIVTNLNSELAGFFIDSPTLRFRITTTDSEGVLGAAVAHFAKIGQPVPVPARRHGSGLVSLQSLLLIMEFGRRRAKDGQNFWMALEEPELHVPPPLQRRLVHRLQALSAQTMVSTHSPMVASISTPGTVYVLRNNGGNLKAIPLHAAPLPATTPNSVRTLFQLRRTETITALMHDILLIPEGRTEYEWFSLLARAVDSAQGWSPDTDCSFAAHVGVVPTHDAAVVETFEALANLHERIVALVDGDAPGKDYVAKLQKRRQKPNVIVSWNDGAMLEDILGWIFAADERAMVTALMTEFTPPITACAELVARLKQDRRQDANGLKGDYIAYEVIADAIARNEPCRGRALSLLNALCDIGLGRTSTLFRQVSPGEFMFIA